MRTFGLFSSEIGLALCKRRRGGMRGEFVGPIMIDEV